MKIKKYWKYGKRYKFVLRFFRKFEKCKNGCWEWNAGNFSDGYGCFAYKQKAFRAHTFSYRIHYGLIKEGKQVNHLCNNKKCVNPEHLESGTQYENMQYRNKCGRQASGDSHGPVTHPEKVLKGIDHHKAKLNEEEVLKIREEYVPRIITHSYLAGKYGVKKSIIGQIIRRVSWKHI